MNISIDKIMEVTEMTYPEIRMVERLFGLHTEDKSNASFEVLLILLVWDFFKRSGMALESFSSAIPPYKDEIINYAKNLLQAIELYQKDGKTFIPLCFFTLIDNRYVGMYFNSTPHHKLWDMVDDQWITTLGNHRPVFTLTLSLPVLYFKVAARHFGHADIAEASKTTKVWS